MIQIYKYLNDLPPDVMKSLFKILQSEKFSHI